MTLGIRVRNPNTGAIVLDLNDRLTTVLGFASTGTSNGSISPSGLSRGEPFFLPLRVTDPAASATYPKFTLGASTISWNFNSNSDRVNTPFVYGVVV